MDRNVVRGLLLLGVMCLAGACKVGLAEESDAAPEPPQPDAGPACVWFRDADQDGYGDPTMLLERCDQPGGYVDNDDDCDDTDAGANIDMPWHPDADGDTYGDPGETRTQCGQPAGHVLDATDCNDLDADEHPGQVWHLDYDMDGFGHPAVTMDACARPALHVPDGRDCDDMDPAVHPGTGACPFTPADAQSCLDILTEGRSEGTGAYQIDPTGGGAPFTVWCDMELDGGGWTALTNPSDDGMSGATIPNLMTSWSHTAGTGSSCTGYPSQASQHNFWGYNAYDCGNYANQYVFNWPNGFGATDVAFVATLMGGTHHNVTVDGVDIPPDATSGDDICAYWSSTGAMAPPGTPSANCASTWLDAPPRVINDAFTGVLDLVIDIGTGCLPTCSYGISFNLHRVYVR